MNGKNIRQHERNTLGRNRKANHIIILVAIIIAIVTGILWFLSYAESVEKEHLIINPAENSQSGSNQSSNTDTEWNLTLVNKWNHIPENYEINLVEIPGGEKVDERIYGPLMELMEAAEAEGLEPIVVSGYRTHQKQQELFDAKVKEYKEQGYSDGEAVEQANMWVSVPGYSEHQLGIAVDINGAFYDVYLWLQENSYKYGFIFRYPASKTDITGAAEEVWHYRYVGVEAATEMYEQGLCLEEYLKMKQSETSPADSTNP